MALPLIADGLIKTANRDQRKGNYQVYQLYKRRLECMALSPEAYEEAVKQLASALGV